MLENRLNELRNQLDLAGTARPNILSKLGKQHNFIEAISSELGVELLKELSAIADDRLDKIINEEASTQEIAEFRVCKNLLIKWGNKVKAYEKNLESLRRK